MILETKKICSQYTRKSKLGSQHTYNRKKTIVVIKCDSCEVTFERELGTMDYKRLDNKYYHVCSNCNQKQFAQKKSVEHRRFWDLPVNSDIDISRI